MPKPTELYRIDDALIVGLTQLAVKVRVEGEDYWFPFSEIREPDALDIRLSRGLMIELVVPAWMAREKGLI